MYDSINLNKCNKYFYLSNIYKDFLLSLFDSIKKVIA